jgi:hypothetical protein
MGRVRGTHYATFMAKVAQISCEIALNLRFAFFLGAILHIIAKGDPEITGYFRLRRFWRFDGCRLSVDDDQNHTDRARTPDRAGVSPQPL